MESRAKESLQVARHVKAIFHLNTSSKKNYLHTLKHLRKSCCRPKLDSGCSAKRVEAQKSLQQLDKNSAGG